MNSNRIQDIYLMAITQPEFNEQLRKNDFDILWLKSKLKQDDYVKLKEIIFDYGNNNNEILFKAGFQYAWDLFLQCNK